MCLLLTAVSLGFTQNMLIQQRKTKSSESKLDKRRWKTQSKRKKKHITTSNNSKWHLNWEKIHSSEQQQFCYPEALFLKNLFPFAIPLLRREMYPHWVEKTNALESSFSVWDSGAFLFVSPLEPSLPWEPCRPGNKQSFVSTDPLCPAARLQTSTPVLIGNHRKGVRSSWGRGAFSHPPVLSSLPIKTSTVRQGAVVLWWPPNQKLFHQHPPGTNAQHNAFGIS